MAIHTNFYWKNPLPSGREKNNGAGGVENEKNNLWAAVRVNVNGEDNITAPKLVRRKQPLFSVKSKWNSMGMGI